MSILFSDFDNTIYFKDDMDKTFNNINAINKFIESGNIFTIVTGRNYNDIKKEIDRYNIPYSYLICCDGAIIFDCNDNCLDVTVLENNIIDDIIDKLNIDSSKIIFDNGYHFTDSRIGAVRVVLNKDDCIDKNLCILNNDDIWTYMSTKHININSKCNDKKFAVYKLIKLLGIVDSIHVIGDSVNDYCMLKEFNGVTVENHANIIDHLGINTYDSLEDYINFLINSCNM